MDLARHSNINLTLARYSHTLLADRAVAVAGLPDLTPRRPDCRETKATGTYDSRGKGAHPKGESAKHSAKRARGKPERVDGKADGERNGAFAKPLYGVIPVPRVRIPASPLTSEEARLRRVLGRFRCPPGPMGTQENLAHRCLPD